MTLEDAGHYECQATTHPPQSIVTQLKVVGKLLLVRKNKVMVFPGAPWKFPGKSQGTPWEQGIPMQFFESIRGQ